MITRTRTKVILACEDELSRQGNNDLCSSGQHTGAAERSRNPEHAVKMSVIVSTLCMCEPPRNKARAAAAALRVCAVQPRHYMHVLGRLFRCLLLGCQRACISAPRRSPVPG